MAYCDIPGDVEVRVGDEGGGRRKLSSCVPVVPIREIIIWPQPTGWGGRQPGNIFPSQVGIVKVGISRGQRAHFL